MEKSKSKSSNKNTKPDAYVSEPFGPVTVDQQMAITDALTQRVYDRLKKMAEMRREIAALNTGIYNAETYELMEKVVFIIAFLFAIVIVSVLSFLLYIAQYGYAVAALGIGIVYVSFIVVFYSRQRVSMKAGAGSWFMELKKEDIR
ncbi:MAG: hypothetical protein Sv326_0508 [Candidatus Fermentimicrarchaeum limneticum]|uniref:Uncharacterized protein n=1 Tax=Fermentimicrarchaeum limneticum TaxID=2795018 RepID=A0A7D6BQC8_FERL1|nr:MAG: hypothetical protein Sv326_0508 [Candidatus Fermentimicrarchaeum limneticum]